MNLGAPSWLWLVKWNEKERSFSTKAKAEAYIKGLEITAKIQGHAVEIEGPMIDPRKILSSGWKSDKDKWKDFCSEGIDLKE